MPDTAKPDANTTDRRWPPQTYIPLRHFYIEPLPKEEWHTCSTCGGSGSVHQERDLHRSAGIIPCTNHHCARGTVVSHTVDRTPEPLKSEIDRLEALRAEERERQREQIRRAFRLPK